MTESIIRKIEQLSPGNAPIFIHTDNGGTYTLQVRPASGGHVDESGRIQAEILDVVNERLKKADN